jgi:hypothetical protein
MMSKLKSFTASLLSAFTVVVLVAACTPEYARQQGEEWAGQARLFDSVDIERRNQRLLSSQAQVCLISANGGEEQGAELLHAIQAGFSGYFLAVSAAGESIDYLRAVSGTPCPDASYLFYVQPIDPPSCDAAEKCQPIASQYLITVISAGDQTLVDRVKLSIKSSFFPAAASESERRQKAFEQLAIALTGAK